MRLARFVLIASAAPFAALGLAFLLAPHALAAQVGLTLAGSAADADVRAVYGGLQLGCALVLGAAALSPSLVRAGIAAQLAFYGGLAGARFASLAIAGAPSALGLALHGAELVAFACGVAAWRSLRARAGSPAAASPGPGLEIRRATAEDLAAIFPLVAAFQREEGYPADEATLRAATAELLADGRAGAVLLLCERERAAGYAALCLGFSIEYRGRDGFVDELYLAPALRGRGLGRALLRALEAEARSLGVRALHLEVEARNDGARQLYLGEGFAASGRELLTKRLG